MMNDKLLVNGWQQASSNVFWGEIAPSGHVVQIYENDEIFLDLLEGYVGGGFKVGDCVVVIATSDHIKSLNDRLWNDGFNLTHFTVQDQYIFLDAQETLSKFMVNGWPDEQRFNETVSTIMRRARKNQRPVRAFGEMAALLWAQGNNGATVQLEHLWNKFCENESFCLLCAYPKSGFTQNAEESMKSICCTHSKLISGSAETSKTEILYKMSSVAFG